MEKEISVLMVRPMERPKTVKLKNDLSSLQAAVNGLIEILEVEDNACILCNEEGKLIGLKGNRRLYNDILVGDFYVCGSDNNGNLTSLSPKLTEKYAKKFWNFEEFTEEEIENSIVFEFIENDDFLK